MKSLLIPQREFAFVADTFGLIQDSGLDGERLARERDESAAARRASEAAQVKLPLKRSVKKQPVKAKRHARHA
jgi:hypothetical protein